MRVRFKRDVEVSHPTDEKMLRVVVPCGVEGVVVQVMPFFRVRLDDLFQDKIRAVSWHQSARVFEDIESVEDDDRRLWVVK